MSKLYIHIFKSFFANNMSIATSRRTRPSTTRYVTWFGTYTSARHSTVLSHYSNMLAHPYANYEYDCTCTESDVYAYVYPSEYDHYLRTQ